MRATTLIATLALTGGIIGAGAMFVPAFAQNAATATTSTTTTATQANWMTTEQVQTKLESAGYRDFEKFERDSKKYEVKATDAQGRRVELDVDPVTGDILKTEVKRSK